MKASKTELNVEVQVGLDWAIELLGLVVSGVGDLGRVNFTVVRGVGIELILF